MAIIDVAAALVFRGGRLLITQRPVGSHLAGLWEFPGGKLEPNESFENCLVRELREELGIEVTVGPLVQTVLHEYPEKTVQLKFFKCDWREKEPRAIGCPAFRWVNAEQLADYDFPPADAILLKTLAQDREFWSSSS